MTIVGNCSWPEGRSLSLPVSARHINPYTMPMCEYHFRIAISAERYLAHYQGLVHGVVVTLADGTRLEFPAESLRPFVTHDGIYGQFVLRVDANNKLQSLQQVGD